MQTFSLPPEIPSSSAGVCGGSVSSRTFGRIGSWKHNDLQVSALSMVTDTSAHACTYMQQCADAANTSVCVHGHIRANVLVSTSLLRCLCVRSLPITLSGEWPEGRGEQLAVTPVPRTSSGPMRQLKLDVCALSASSNSYESLQQSKCY